MGLRYYKRIGGNKGWGINFSKSGISSSYRSQWGSIGTKGFSIKTSIPGLTYKTNWKSKGKKGDAALIFLIVMTLLSALYLSIIIAYNLLKLFAWLSIEGYKTSAHLYNNWKQKRIDDRTSH